MLLVSVGLFPRRKRDGRFAPTLTAFGDWDYLRWSSPPNRGDASP